MIVGGENIAKISPFLESFAAARSSAKTIFRIIDRNSKIDSMSNDGKLLNLGVQGNIVFKNVFFSYPSRPGAQVKHHLIHKLNGFNTVVTKKCSKLGLIKLKNSQ